MQAARLHGDKKLYRPASSVLDELASNESSSAEDNDKDQDNRLRAVIAWMVYLSTDGKKINGRGAVSWIS